MKNLYVGAAGVLFALDELRRRGHAETRLDLAELARRQPRALPRAARLHEDRGASPSRASRRSSAARRGSCSSPGASAPSDELADDLLARVRANVANDADEVMWGTPGTLIAARAMLEWTGDERWREAWHESADALWSRRGDDGLWTQRLYGEARPVPRSRRTGSSGTCRRSGRCSTTSAGAALERETAAVLERTAVVEDGLANWPPSDRAGARRAGRCRSASSGAAAAPRDRRRRGRLPRRGAAARRRGADLARRAARRGEGRRRSATARPGTATPS